MVCLKERINKPGEPQSSVLILTSEGSKNTQTSERAISPSMLLFTNDLFSLKVDGGRMLWVCLCERPTEPAEEHEPLGVELNVSISIAGRTAKVACFS